jgi:N-acetylmuramoyl-L-alanine amidase
MVAKLASQWFNRAMRTRFSLISSQTLMMAAALLAIFSSSQAAELKDMKILAMDGQTQAELSLSGKSNYKFFSLSKPERLVVDLPATSLPAEFKLPGINGVISRVRTGQPVPGTVRVVFELSKTIQAKPRLEGEGANTRLVFELIDPNAKPVSPSVHNSSIDTVAVVNQSAISDRPEQSSTPEIESTIADVKPSAQTNDHDQPDAQITRKPGAKTMQSVWGNRQRALVIAIDAGHGGKDPGAIGPTGVREKNITLATARELAKQINSEPGMKAVLIRDTDVFVPLQERFMKARQAQADLFISIHADAALNENAHGSSVYVLSLKGASSQAARWLADKENAADLVGGVTFNKDQNLNAVLLDLSLSATMRVSDDVAANVLTSLKDLGKAHKKNVEHANFVVLRSPDVPSMLIETGFITNANEERNLSDPAHRSKIAKAIVTGVRDYFSKQAPPGTWFAARLNEKESVASSSPAPKPRQHVVTRGETLSNIAAHHGVPKDRILQANKKRNDDVRVGERLVIPSIVAGMPPQ